MAHSSTPKTKAAKLKYEDILGPPVRIGVLQEAREVKINLSGRYRVVFENGESSEPSAKEFVCQVGSSKPAKLQWRLVLKKAFSEDEAAQAVASNPSLEPLSTVQLGVGFGSDATAVEYWRCSRPFDTPDDAEEARKTLADPARVPLLKELAVASQGSVTVLSGEKAQSAGLWVRFEPIEPDTARVTVHDVIVGLEYHWRHFERQRFRGVIEVRIDNTGQLTTISELPVEAYLFSVNSSEMMSVMPEELLKAQTVAARNTMFATMGKHHYAEAFHLCADDHCQCYRGSSRETSDSRRVTLATAGEVMISGSEICDARYSKCCGGFMEAFESVWNEDPRVYLPAGVDADPGSDAHALFPADTEERAAALINAKPNCWCNTTGDDVPQYLKYTAPYFRWKFRYTRDEAAKLISKYLKTDIGELRELIPVKRGKSGRIEFLKIVASGGEWTIGKELQIRKALSPTCLYSTAFVVEHERDSAGNLTAVTLNGGGWGHGAGLCQIGATMMAYRGRDYREILTHYYPNTKLQTLAPAETEERLTEVIAHRESRKGERCFEFYNCYAVAQCPVYLEGVRLEATENGDNAYVFEQTEGAIPVDLAARGINCQFLEFLDRSAKPKT